MINLIEHALRLKNTLFELKKKWII
jgi:hypothetical protein